MSYLITVLRLLSLDPLEASTVAARAVGHPELARELRGVCWREAPRCRRVGIHRIDRWAGRRAYRNAHRVGWLSQECPHHVGEPVRFSTRGPWGAMAAYTLRHLPSPCAPPEILDVPIIGALAVAKRMIHQCRRYGACTRRERHAMWKRGPK